MKIDRLYINNYKSLVDFELTEPNAFSVFVGPNAAGKSNVFEALEFVSLSGVTYNSVDELFGGGEKIVNKKRGRDKNSVSIEIFLFMENLTLLDTSRFETRGSINFVEKEISDTKGKRFTVSKDDFKAFIDQADIDFEKSKKELRKFNKILSRIFVGKNNLVKIKNQSSNRLALDASNLEKVLKMIR